jgi:hypothetical protein
MKATKRTPILQGFMFLSGKISHVNKFRGINAIKNHWLSAGPAGNLSDALVARSGR